nr:CHAT domain-containing protein [Streptomyces sp. S1D4-11]
MGPVEELLAEVQRLMIVPHGILHAVPFAALRGSDGYLIEQRTVVVAPVRQWLSGPAVGSVRSRTRWGRARSAWRTCPTGRFPRCRACPKNWTRWNGHCRGWNGSDAAGPTGGH